MKKKLVITIIISSIVCVLSIGLTWYFMDQKLKDQKSEYDIKISDIQNKINAQASVEDETSSWVIYENDIFSIKYPRDWVFDDSYEQQEGVNMVAFGESKEFLPAKQSDQMIGISILSTKDLSKRANFVSDSLSLGVKPISLKVGVNDYVTLKYTLLPGRENDMYGDTKITKYYVMEGDDPGSVLLYINNIEDYQSSIFDKMLNTIKIK